MKVEQIPVEKIKRLNRQPRQYFNEESLQQLANSIEQVGQLQPVIVKKEGPDYFLIAGERRLRALKKSQQKVVAAIILEENLQDATIRQIQLVENLQREDLNALERAIFIQRFMADNGLTKKEASEKLGVPRTTLTEWLNILEVNEKYQQAVIDEDSPLSLSHITLAKALVSRTGDPTKIKQLLDGVLKYNLTRSETRDIVELFFKYLNLSMEEAIAAILLRRGTERFSSTVEKNSRTQSDDIVKGLFSSLSNVGNKLEKLMEEVGYMVEADQEKLIDEFLYIYQLIGIMIPGFNQQSLQDIINNRIKER